MKEHIMTMIRQSLTYLPLIALGLSYHVAHAATSKPEIPTLCAPDEQVAFTCPIAHSKSHKIVSLCLAPGNAKPPAARYIFGTKKHTELVYPAKGTSSTEFKTSFLGYMDGTAGNAYSFINGHTKYILYQVEGADLKEAGILIQPIDQIDASVEIHCKYNTANYAFNSNILTRKTRIWKSDPKLDGKVLPQTK